MITKEELEAKLEPYWAERPVWRHADIGPGWYQLVFDLVDDLAQIWPEFRVGQVKEKFGGLRFYPESYKADYEGQPLSESKMYQLIAAAEDKSYKTCETCGDPGEERRNSWIQTLCDKHAQEKA